MAMYGYNGTVLECTRGFNVKQIKGAVYGTSTAGHCDDRGTDAQTGVSQAFKQEWVTNNVDSQWSTFSGKSKYHIVPMFYNGYSILTVTEGQSDYSGLYVCKYGRTSGQTCGYVDPYQYIDGTYGELPRVNWNSTYDYQSLEGDSGGPVYAGSLGVGQVHGRDGGYRPKNSKSVLHAVAGLAKQ